MDRLSNYDPFHPLYPLLYSANLEAGFGVGDESLAVIPVKPSIAPNAELEAAHVKAATGGQGAEVVGGALGVTGVEVLDVGFTGPEVVTVAQTEVLEFGHQAAQIGGRVAQP